MKPNDHKSRFDYDEPEPEQEHKGLMQRREKKNPKDRAASQKLLHQFCDDFSAQASSLLVNLAEIFTTTRIRSMRIKYVKLFDEIFAINGVSVPFIRCPVDIQINVNRGLVAESVFQSLVKEMLRTSQEYRAVFSTDIRSSQVWNVQKEGNIEVMTTHNSISRKKILESNVVTGKHFPIAEWDAGVVNTLDDGSPSAMLLLDVSTSKDRIFEKIQENKFGSLDKKCPNWKPENLHICPVHLLFSAYESTPLSMIKVSQNRGHLVGVYASPLVFTAAKILRENHYLLEDSQLLDALHKEWAVKKFIRENTRSQSQSHSVEG